MKLPWPLISALALYSIGNGASATTIVVDPGPVGTAQSSYSLSFGDLNDTPLDGRTVSLDFVFDGMKHIEAVPLENTNYRVKLHIGTGPSQSESVPTGTAFLSNEIGDPLFPASDVLTKADTMSWAYIFDTPLTNGLLHHDVHFNVSLPTIAGQAISFGSLQLELSPFVRDKPWLIVGEWTSTPSVPEPATIFLLSLGLAGIAHRKRRIINN
jgi:hypothetical protein